MDNMENVLYISDYVTQDLIPVIVNYFHYFGIANIENVEFYPHTESEYNTDYYPNQYGSLVIYVGEWFDTNVTRNFYERLKTNTCRIVYDDPLYFDVHLYSEYFKDVSSYLVDDNTTITPSLDNTTSNEDSNCLENTQNKYYSEEEEYLFVFESDEEQDDTNDKDYEYKSDNDERDHYFEFYHRDKKYKKNKKKRTINPDVNLDNVSSDVLKAVLIKRNKNYLKNNKHKENKRKENKRKENKNVWSRRLRQKQSE